MVAWRDGKGALRAARRSAPGPLRAPHARVRAIAKSARVDGLVSGVDSTRPRLASRGASDEHRAPRAGSPRAVPA